MMEKIILSLTMCRLKEDNYAGNILRGSIEHKLLVVIDRLYCLHNYLPFRRDGGKSADRLVTPGNAVPQKGEPSYQRRLPL